MIRLLSLLLLLFAIATAAAKDVPSLTADEVAAWREDIAELVEGIERVHPNPYWRVPEDAFDAHAAALLDGLPDMTYDQVVLAVAALVNGIDGHTIFSLAQPGLEFTIAPLWVYDFDDGLFVVDALPPYQDLIGTEITAIGSKPVKDVRDAVRPYIPHDNESSTRWGFAQYPIAGKLLADLGLIDSPAVIPMSFVLPDGTTSDIDVATVDRPTYLAMTTPLWGLLPPREDLLYVSRHRTDNFWMAPLEDGETLYVQYNQVQRSSAGGISISSFATQVREQAANYARVIVDMRHNPGGDNTTYRPLLAALQAIGDGAPGKLVVLVGRHTFSAAANFVTELEQTTDVTFVGEPTGGAPNLYGDARPVRLTNSGLVANISSRYWEKSTPDDTRDAIYPDVEVPVLASDWFAGRDAALEAALSIRP